MTQLMLEQGSPRIPAGLLRSALFCLFCLSWFTSVAWAAPDGQLSGANPNKLRRWSLQEAQILVIPSMRADVDSIRTAMTMAKCHLRSAMGTPMPDLGLMDDKDACETPTMLSLIVEPGGDATMAAETLRLSNCFSVIKLNESFKQTGSAPAITDSAKKDSVPVL